MLNPSPTRRIWACAEPTSMRKSFDGLYASARQSLNRDPRDGDMILFVSRDRKQARVLSWDGSGLVILAKRLEQGRFNAPWEGHRDRPWCLTPGELALFLDGSRLVGQYELVAPRR